MRNYINQKWGKLKNSKFFLGVMCLIIGATFMFVYIQGKDYLEYAVKGYGYATEHLVINRTDASDSPVQAGEPESVSPSQIISKYDWDVKVAMAIAKTESGLNPLAHNENRNGTIDTGLFQINSIHGYSEKELQDPARNVEVAYALYLKAHRTFKPWVTYNANYYLTNLN